MLRLYCACPALAQCNIVCNPSLLQTVIGVMAASKFDLDAAMQALSTEGLYHLDDFLIGQRVSEMEEKEFPYFTEYGLDLYRTILDTVRTHVNTYEHSISLVTASPIYPRKRPRKLYPWPLAEIPGLQRSRRVLQKGRSEGWSECSNDPLLGQRIGSELLSPFASS